MRFLVDECTGPAVAAWLRHQNHEVFSVFEQARGINDEDIIQKAASENWILITNDKDFGDMVYRDGRLHRGVILLRLDDASFCSALMTSAQFQKFRPSPASLRIIWIV